MYEGRELKKSRYFAALLYPDSIQYNVSEVLKNVTTKFEQYAYILHDRDIWTAVHDEEIEYDFTDDLIGKPKKSHIHIVLYSDGPKQLGLVARMLGIKSQYVRCVENKVGAYQYLIHANNPEKTQYGIEEVVTNIENFQKKYFSVDGIMKALNIVEYIESIHGVVSVTQISKWCMREYCWDEFRRGQHIFSAIISEHNLPYQNKNKNERN